MPNRHPTPAAATMRPLTRSSSTARSRRFLADTKQADRRAYRASVAPCPLAVLRVQSRITALMERLREETAGLVTTCLCAEPLRIRPK